MSSSSEIRSRIGSLTQVKFGSDDYDTFSYDPNTGRIDQYKYYVGASPQTVTGDLQWNANGSLKRLIINDQINPPNSQTCNYSHDDLGRIASANCGASIWNQNFSFDPFSNIQKVVPPGSTGGSFLPTYSPSTNRYQEVSGCAPSYDANGFPLYDCAHHYTWDSAGNPRSIETVNLTYDALGRMVEQSSGGVYTQVVYGPGGGKLALMNGQTLKKAFVALPAGAVAVYNVSGLQYYRHVDWLGSARLATTPTRSVYFDVEYGPYGETYKPVGTIEPSFTGQNRDTAAGLFDFLLREYNAVHGRWPWPDPAGLGAVSMASPQTWNRYAYVANSPLDTVDPLGLMRCRNTECPQRLGFNNGFSHECLLDGMEIWCSLLMGFLEDGAAVLRSESGLPPGCNYIGPCMTPYGVVPLAPKANGREFGGCGALPGGDMFCLHFAANPDRDNAPARSASGGIDWGWYQGTKAFIDLVVQGVRKPDQGFGDCVLQNADKTTGGAHGALISAVIVTSATALMRAKDIGNIALKGGEWTGRLLGAGLTVGAGMAIYDGLNFLATAAPVAIAAEGGLLIGSAINCR